MTNEITIPDNNSVVVHNTDDLSRVVIKALKQIEDILDIKVPEGDENIRAKFLSLKKDAAAAIINAGLKADENRFRRENKDIVERLFDKIKKESRIVEGRVIHKG